MSNAIISALGTSAGASTGSMIYMVVIWVVIIGVFYFMAIRPQKKQQKDHDLLINELKVGDSIVTSSGFYGVVIQIVDDNVVVVEFGNNKNCRIPMKKANIAEVEKSE